MVQKSYEETSSHSNEIPHKFAVDVKERQDWLQIYDKRDDFDFDIIINA